MIVRREAVVDTARSYLGTKFRMYGRDRAGGLDCVGFIYRVLTDLGMELDDDTNYSRSPEVEKINAILNKYSKKAPTNPPRHGQLIKIRQFIYPMHLAIIAVEKGIITVIHSNIKKSKVVEQPWAEWKELVIEHREIKGVR